MPHFDFDNGKNPNTAMLKLYPEDRSKTPVSKRLFGKFTEHLGQNVYNGIYSQILFNPTFGDWTFSTEDPQPSGGFVRTNDINDIRARLEKRPRNIYYSSEMDSETVADCFERGCALGWVNKGHPSDTLFSPETGPTGDRAQRVETVHSKDGPVGIYQIVNLPNHRVNRYELRLVGKSRSPTKINVGLGPTKRPQKKALVQIDLDEEWTEYRKTIDLSDGKKDFDNPFELFISLPNNSNIVLDRMLLYPIDHKNGLDPEVIRYLQETPTPIMRWPGGNFASTYHWKDGIGPKLERPTKFNRAWGGLEFNLLGTDEFLQFCELINAEPLICVNAGDGTPAEARAWVEYCNGSPETQWGKKRAVNGHQEPYNVKYWQIGNESFGRWQMRWTTPRGYTHRCKQFIKEMRSADPTINLIGVGDVTFSEKSEQKLENESNIEWTPHVISQLNDSLRMVCDHVLAGGEVDAQQVDRDDLYKAYLAFSNQLGNKYRQLENQMYEQGIEEPRVAITELQLFSRLVNQPDNIDLLKKAIVDSLPTPLKRFFSFLEVEDSIDIREMPTSTTISEALYYATIINESIRRGAFVETITHSGSVNHGGGLQKHRGRIWPDPCYYGRRIMSNLIGKYPVGVDLTCGTISTRNEYREIQKVSGVPMIDAMAVIDAEETELHVAIVNRSPSREPVLTIDVSSFANSPHVSGTQLYSEDMSDRNSYKNREKVEPESLKTGVSRGSSDLTLPVHSLTHITYKREG